MKFIFQEVKEFDVEKEKRRINKCFKGKLNKKLHKIVDLFCEEKFQECMEIYNSLEYDAKEGKEFVSIFIANSLRDWSDNPTLTIYKMIEYPRVALP